MRVGNDLDNMPQTVGGTPINGQFPYKYTVTDETEYMFAILLSDLVLDCDDVAFVVVHADVLVDDGNGGTIGETAYGGDNPGGESRWWYYMNYTICCGGDVQPTCEKETAWGGSIKGDGKSWWYYFDTEGSAEQPIYAGQYLTDGTVTYRETEQTLTIDLGSWVLQDVDEAVKVEGYDNILLNKRPVAGKFTLYKGKDLIVDLKDDESRYYAIHLDVMLCE